MNTLLIKPDLGATAKGSGAPLGIAYIASNLQKHNHKVKIIDFCVEDLEYEQIPLTDIDVLGITCSTAERFDAFKIAKIAKKYNPNIKVVIGGVHITFTAKQTIRNIAEIDVAVGYEGEQTMADLLEAWENNRKLDSIKGITYNHLGHIKTTPLRPLEKDLDKLPLPARDLLSMEKYTLHLSTPEQQRVTNVIANRGCPFRCKFCSASELNQHKIRSRSAENILDEIETIMKNYTYLDGIYFYDDHFTANKKVANGVCKGIKERKLDISWGCFGRVDAMTKDLAINMKGAGCKTISFGIESGSQKVLNNMTKGVTTTQAKNAISICKSVGIVPRASLIFGYPKENAIDIFQTYNFLKKTGLKIKDTSQGHHLLLFPGTQITQELEYLPKNYDWTKPCKLPNWKGIPQYLTKHDRLRVLYTRVLRKAFVLMGT